MEGLLDRLAALEDRHRELSLRVIDPEIIADPEAYRMAMRDYSELDPPRPAHPAVPGSGVRLAGRQGGRAQ